LKVNKTGLGLCYEVNWSRQFPFLSLRLLFLLRRRNPHPSALFNSALMQQDALFRRDSEPSTKLGSARSRLRDFRKNLSNTFRKSSKNKPVRTFTSPPRSGPPECSQFSSSRPPVLLFPLEDSVADSFTSIMDGATERMFRRSESSQARPANVAAIFVHAGAGYHSNTNEHIHLGACDRFVVILSCSNIDSKLN